MHHNAASAMAQRADMLRGLSPRESSLALNYGAGPRGGWPRAPRAGVGGGAAVLLERPGSPGRAEEPCVRVRLSRRV